MYLVNIVNIMIVSLDFFSKTAQCLLKMITNKMFIEVKKIPNFFCIVLI